MAGEGAHVSTALPTTGVEGAAMSRGSIGPARNAARPASIAWRESARHRDGIARLRDRGIEQHAVVAKLHRRRGMRRHADAGVDDQRNVREMRAQRAQAKHIVEPLPEPIGAPHGISTLHPASMSRSATTRSSVV